MFKDTSLGRQDCKVTSHASAVSDFCCHAMLSHLCWFQGIPLCSYLPGALLQAAAWSKQYLQAAAALELAQLLIAHQCLLHH